MPRNWDDENEDNYEEDETGSQGSRSRSRSPVRSRESGVITGTKARDICNDPDTIDARICVMGLNQSVDKEMIEEYFTQFGKVVAIFVLRNKRNAFVQFEDEEDAKECLTAGDNAQIGDVDALVKPAKQGSGDSNKQPSPQQQQQQQKKMLNKGNRNRGGKKNVDFNDPNTADARVFVDPVNGAITKTDIQDSMEKFGMVLGVQIQSRKDKNMPRYAFVQFRDNNSARNCIRRKNMSIKGYNLMVRSVTSSSNKAEDLPRLSDINIGSRNRPLALSESTTSDPMTARARVYVGNIRGDSISKEDLRTFFSNFGIITSVSLHKKKDGKKGFAFVQYSDEEGAQNCLLVGKSVFLHGQQLEIGPVKSEQQNGSNSINLRGGGGGGGGSISPWDMQGQGPFENSGNTFGLNSLMNMSSSSFNNSGMGMGQNLSNISLSPNPSMNMLDPTRPNDAEIVVASVAQRSYAEFVESQLLSMNLKVDMIFPPPGISTTKIIMDLIKRKCLFALLITEENELRRSVTLHVLQGPLQAHCNIPISNALRLIEENFTEYIQMSRRPAVGGSVGGGGGGMMSMGQGMLGNSNFGPNSGAPGSLFGSPPSNFGDSRGGGMGGRGNAGNGLLGPVPNDGSGLMGPAPGVGGSGVGPQAGDMGGMYSLVLDSVKMARELRSVKGEMDVKEIMQGRDFQERVAALKAKANAVKHTMMGPGGGGGPPRLGGGLF